MKRLAGSISVLAEAHGPPGLEPHPVPVLLQAPVNPLGPSEDSSLQLLCEFPGGRKDFLSVHRWAETRQGRKRGWNMTRVRTPMILSLNLSRQSG